MSSPMIIKDNGTNEDACASLPDDGSMPAQGYSRALVVNDQGGQCINMEDDVSPTLRAQCHGHPPIVFSDKNSAHMNMNPSETVSPSLRITSIPSVMVNLNKDDFQSKGIYHEDGIAPPLYAGENRFGGGECYVLRKEYDISKNGTSEK